MSLGAWGVGPLFNATSCNACHTAGGRAHGPAGDGPAPVGLVIELESPAAQRGAETVGDAVYGRVFNTFAVGGLHPEGTVSVRYSEIAGYYIPSVRAGPCGCRITSWPH